MYNYLFPSVEVALQNTTGYLTQSEIGESVSFTCTADGINRPVITWRKDGQLILSTERLHIDSVNDIQGFRSIPGIKQITSSLTISDLKERDSGSYSCRADNEAEIPVSLDSPFVLLVSGNLSVTIIIYIIISITSWIRSIVFTCTRPMSDISWVSQ